MTLSDVAALTLLNWDTVKAITKTHLARDYGKPALRDVRYQSLHKYVHPMRRVVRMALYGKDQSKARAYGSRATAL